MNHESAKPVCFNPAYWRPLTLSRSRCYSSTEKKKKKKFYNIVLYNHNIFLFFFIVIVFVIAVIIIKIVIIIRPAVLKCVDSYLMPLPINAAFPIFNKGYDCFIQPEDTQGK